MYDIGLMPHNPQPEEILLLPSSTFFLVTWQFVFGLALGLSH